MSFTDFIIGIGLLLFTFLIYRWYINWRKFKREVYGQRKLEVWDYKLSIGYWGVMIISAVSTLIFILKGVFIIE
jgi:uncharacterized membrane protein YidH (DUF202 family)